MDRIPRNKQEMCDLLAEAMTAPLPRDQPNYNHLKIVASGRINSLSRQDRQAVLQQIAANPDAARFVADFVAKRPIQPRRQIRTAKIGWVNILLQLGSQFWLRPALALAVCAALALGIWRFADPVHVIRNDDGQFELMKAPDTTSTPDSYYWKQLDQQRLVEIEHRQLWRDVAFYIACGATLIFAVPLTAWVLLPRRERAESPQKTKASGDSHDEHE